MPHFILDENLSRRLTDKVTLANATITHVASERLLHLDDREIWKYAKNISAVIITKDHDFFDMSHLYGCPPKVIKLTCGNRTTDFIANLLSNNADIINNFTESAKCYLEIF